MTQIVITNEHGTYKVSTEEDGMNVPDLINLLIIPALLSAGYAHNSVMNVIKDV